MNNTISVGNLNGRNYLGRAGHKWEDDIDWLLNETKECGLNCHVTQDRVHGITS
jgi:hypothetical protein